MAIATSTMLAIGAGMSAVSSISSGVQAKEQGNIAAGIYEQQAGLAESQGEIQSFQKKQDIRRFERQASAQVGMNSGSLSGSYLQSLNESFTNAELDVNSIEFNSALNQQNYLTQATSARQAGNTAMMQGLVGAGSSALTGYAGYKSNLKKGD